MKRIVALILILMLLLVSCNVSKNKHNENAHPEHSVTTEVVNPSIPKPDESNPDETPPVEDQPNTPETNHSYQSVVTAPTCNADGYTTYTCSTCGDSYVADIVASSGHIYTGAVTDPTCNSEGYTSYTCSVCDFSYIADKVSALGHNYNQTTTSSPTCENHGYTIYVCTRCEDSYIEDIGTSDHGYITSVTAPTCNSEGYTTYTCSACGDSYVANKVAALGHSYKTSTVGPSCESDGYTTYTCSTCNNSYVADNVDALGHSYTTSVTAPTCTGEGYTTYTCSTCNDSYVSDKTAALEHNCNSSTTEPTCDNMGYTTYICITCNYSYVADYIDALGHIWKNATTEAPKTCTTCGATEGDKLESTTPSTPVPAPTLYVTYINVGQGDSILIKVEDCDILIDAGTASYGSTVSNYLKNQKVDDLELVINTHPDSDHCGGLTQVFKDHKVEEVWISKDTNKTTAAYKNFVSAISSEGLTAKKPNVGTVYTYEYLTLTVIYSAIGSDSNNSSIVVMLEYGSFKFLFTGDIGEEVETQLVKSGADLECDVLKVGHHGSKYSSTTSFLSKVSAEYGVICVGNNSYGHPTSATLNRLSSAGVSVYRTDENGNVAFSTNGKTLYLPNGSTDTSGSGSGLPSGGTSSGGSSSSGSTSGGSSSSGSISGSTTTSDIFIGNTETKVFHLPTCSNLPAASKQNTMYNYWWIVNIAGYTPCGRCLKNYNTGATYIANATSKVYHISTCSYLPSSSNRVYITSTTGYTPCGHCIN